MDGLTLDDLRDTIRLGEGPCVSLFMPAHKAGLGIDEDRIRFKNLLRAAEKRLTEIGRRPPDARRLLEPARRLLDDSIFWERQSEGLAVFVATGFFHYYRVPVSIGELVVVAGRFYVRPLLPLLAEEGEFYVLALSQSNVSLFRQSRFSVEEIGLPGAPHGLADAVKHEHPERQAQVRVGASPRGGGRSTQFHSHGGKAEDAKDLLRTYFRQIDQSLRKLLASDHAPLVLAGVEYLFPVYRRVNSYPHLLESGVPGNPEEVPAEEIHRRAWEIVRPEFEGARKRAAEHYDEISTGSHASADVKDVVAAAYAGRMDTLFVAGDAQCWGVVDLPTGNATLHDSAQAGDEDLLDAAASQTLLHGGTVYAVQSEEIPGGGPAAAILRY